jgi:hypothetical protein
VGAQNRSGNERLQVLGDFGSSFDFRSMTLRFIEAPHRRPSSTSSLAGSGCGAADVGIAVVVAVALGLGFGVGLTAGRTKAVRFGGGATGAASAVAGGAADGVVSGALTAVDGTGVGAAGGGASAGCAAVAWELSASGAVLADAALDEPPRASHVAPPPRANRVVTPATARSAFWCER